VDYKMPESTAWDYGTGWFDVSILITGYPDQKTFGLAPVPGLA
jgi:hypothetical protein